MGYCYLPPERAELTLNSKKETNWQGQNGPRVKMGSCCVPPERVKLTMNNKKERNGRFKMGQESKWAKGEDGLVLFTQ